MYEDQKRNFEGYTVWGYECVCRSVRFPDDTYEVVYEDADMAESGGADRMKQNAAEDWEMLSEEEIFERLLQAEEEQVIVKSRLLEWLRQQAD